MNKTVLITGATGGIGAELAKVFAKNGYSLLLTGRNEKKLEELKSRIGSLYGVRVMTFAADLSCAGAPEELFSFAKRCSAMPEILVNNAGLGDYGPFASSSWDKQLMIMKVNMEALVHLTHLFLKPMIEGGSGKILNVASIASFQPGPLMSVYYASKAFVLSFSEALSTELKSSGIGVTALCPGPTETGFAKTANQKNSGLTKKLKSPSAAKVAEYGYKYLMKNKAVAVPGLLNHLALTGSKLAPRGLVRQAVYFIQKIR